MTTTLHIDIYFDLICPWCFIGKRHLDQARQQFRAYRPDIGIVTNWKSSPLLPEIPWAGLPYQAFYEARLGSTAAVSARRTQVRNAARAAGIEIAFESIEMMPNTRLAHGLIGLARQQAPAALTETLIDRIFAAYFLEGRDIGKPSELLAVAADCGLVVPEIPAATLAELPDDDRRPVSGVPFYVFNDRHAVSGAHPAATLVDAMRAAIE